MQLLLRKRIEFDWGEDQIEAFGRVKEWPISFLAPPQLGKHFVIYTDASDIGIGGVIEQDGTPILYHSRLLESKLKS